MASITDMIRLDHTHVMALFHKYRPDAPARVKRGLIDQICLAVEVHAELEEEIFYPALRAVMEGEVLRKSEPDHMEIKRLVATLRGMDNGDSGLDRALYELVQHIIHHVADEETVLLPAAETKLAGELSRLGSQMTRRRLQLMAPMAPQLASGMARSLSGTSMALAAGAMLIGGLMVARRRPLMDVLKQASRELRKRRLVATARNLLPGPKSLSTKLLAR